MSYGYPAPQGYNAYAGYGTPYPVRRSAPCVKSCTVGNPTCW